VTRPPWLSWAGLACRSDVPPTEGSHQQNTTGSGDPVAYAGTANFYNITSQGTVLGRPFARQGILAFTTPIPIGTTNGANPFEVVIVSGNPAISPEIGAIQFTTNTFLFGGPGAVDMAYVSFANNCAFINPDSRISATGLNVFNALSGLAADVYQIFAGTIQICSRNTFQTISGSINVLGTGPIFHSNSPYQATVSGSFSGSEQF
jgi:hypothetical protein